MRRKAAYLPTLAAALAAFAMIASSLPLAAAPTPADQCRFLGLNRFEDFTVESTNAESRVFLSPVIKAPIDWNALIVSWNSTAAKDSWLKLEARGIYPDRQTKYYTLALWSADPAGHPRQSVRGQKDGDGDVKTDTLLLRQPGADAQVRVTLGGCDLKFMGFCFFDSRVSLAPPASDHRAWGKIIETPERSQHGYPNEAGWCSPTSVSMVLARWGALLNRPEMNLTVPEVVSNVYDTAFGTGNWILNTAFAGSFPGLRAYVTRFSDITELESWINAGIPVILSAPWHLLSPGRKNTGSGHLIVCVGFTENGDVVINDPATNLQLGQNVRHIYTRENVINAWKTSHNTVYLIYPENTPLPPDPNNHWDRPQP